MRTSFQALGSWGLVIALSLLLVSCGEETTPPEREFDPLTTEITAGPEGSVPAGATISFAWVGKGGKAPITGYAYALDGEVGEDWASVTMVTFTDVTQGSHTFSVKAYADTAGWDDDPEELQYYVQVDPTERDFQVTAGPAEDTVPPDVSIVSGPGEGSKYATGSTVTFVWEATDSTAVGEGSVAAYSYALDDTAGGTWDTWGVTTTAVYADLADGDRTFYVRAVDGAGNIGMAMRSFTVKPASILLVDNADESAGGGLTIVEEAALDKWYRDFVVKDYAYEEWDTSEKGTPTAADLAPYSTVLWYNAYTGNYADLTDPLAEYLDGGGNVWLSDYENLWAYDSIGPGAFPTEYLLVGEWDGTEDDLTIAVGLADGYPDMQVFASPQTGGDSYIFWVDTFTPTEGATAVYAFNGAAGDPCAVVGDAGTGKMAFFAFPLWPMPPTEVQQVAVQVLTEEFGE
jgi:hypothetical protein